MKKILTLVVVMLLGATSLMAQNPDKGLSFAGEFGIGTEVQFGGRAQYNFNKYIALDIVSLKYAYDFNDIISDFHEITIQTGIRGFSPNYYKDMKAFAAIDLGYGASFSDFKDESHFALDFTIGTYVWKGLYVGYGFEILRGATWNGHNDHLFRIGYNF
jgi:hypothetical protein